MSGLPSLGPGHRRRLAATVVTGLLAVSGVAFLGVAVTSPQPTRQPPVSKVDSAGPSPRGVAGSPRQGAPEVVGPVLATSRPVALAIPAIGVDSAMLGLGLGQTADGAMEVPAPGPEYDKPGWYRYSPTPGALGPAVIAGHVDSAENGPSVFFRLASLRPRDKVRVTRADGSVAVFAVDDVRRYRKTRFPSRLVYGNTDHAALRLITCGGPFDRDSGSYRDNIIVLASLIG